MNGSRFLRWITPRFGLRTVFVVISIVCLLLGGAAAWYRTKAAQYDYEETVLERIYKAHGAISCDVDAPAWLRGWVWNWQALARISEIECDAECDVDGVLDEVPNLSLLRVVNLDNAVLTAQLRARINRMGLDYPLIDFQRSEVADGSPIERHTAKRYPGPSIPY
jgi:hypothetical protein